MSRTGSVVVLFLLAVPTLAQGPAEPWRFRWHKGQALTYQVDQTTSATETVKGVKTEAVTRLRHVKVWNVLDVDGQGIATLQMSLKALRFEMSSPRGDLLFDSADLAKSDTQLREQMQNYVGSPLAVLRLDPYGRVVEVKESKHGPARRFEVELPFTVLLPAVAPQPGQSWERSFEVTLDPPQGTGEKFAAVQRYTCKTVTGPLATVGVTTALKQPPEAAADQIPLLQVQPEGEVEFDTRTGTLRNATLKIAKDIKDHQGEASLYQFRSTYVETRLD